MEVKIVARVWVKKNLAMDKDKKFLDDNKRRADEDAERARDPNFIEKGENNAQNSWYGAKNLGNKPVDLNTGKSGDTQHPKK